MTKTRARNYFKEQLVKFDSVDFWWLEDRLISRAVHVQIRMTVPPHAEYIGRYAYPFPAEKFLSDLDDALARINAAANLSPAMA